MLTRTYSEGLINVSCTVRATDSTGTGGCVMTTRKSLLTVEGKRGDPSNHCGCAMALCAWLQGGGVLLCVQVLYLHV